MKLQFLGTGAGFSVGLGNTSAIMYNTNPKDGFTMLDCGEHARSKLVELGIVDSLKNIIITHTHGDHYFGLEMLAFYWYFVKKEKLNVFLPSDAIKEEIVKSLSPTLCKVQDENGNPIEKSVEDFLNIVVAKEMILDNITYKFFNVPHVPQKDCYGVQIRTENGVSLYTSDINKPVWDILDEFTNLTYTGLVNYRWVFHDAQLYDGKKGAVHAYIGDLKRDMTMHDTHTDSEMVEHKNKLILMHYGKPQTESEQKAAKEWCGGFALPGQIFEI